MASKLPGGLQNVSRQAVRIAKNYTKGYSDMQTKVRDATSNDPWGPSGAQMNEIAQATYNQQDFIEIMEQMDRRMNDKGKNWRHVFKALTVLDYILHNGSDNTVLYFQENIYIVKTLREFEYVDEQGKDQGANVRQKAKDIVNLLLDDKRMKAQRRQRSDMRDRMNGRDRRDSDDEDESVARARANMRRAQERPPEPEDDDLARALAESKKSADADADRLRRLRAEEDDLAKAIRMSQEDDERRRQDLSNNRNGLFDSDHAISGSSKPNDGWDSLLDPGQPMQPQPTGFASFNPYAAQQQQQQEEWMRQQQLLEMQRQQLELQAQMQAAAQAQAEHEAYQQMLLQQQMQQQQQQLLYQQQMAAQQQSMQPLIPQMTSIGSNNPFAAFSQTAPARTPSPLPQPAPLPVQVPQVVKPPKDDGKYSHLASLLGNRDDGVDTFGNVGALRYGRHAPGGTNPFNRQQQLQQTPQQQQQQNQQPLLEL